MSTLPRAWNWVPLPARPSGLIWDSAISKVGWTVQGDDLRLVTESRGSWFQYHGDSLGVAGAYARRTQAVLLALNRLLYHDLNGKIMGIDGILTIWGMQFPDETALQEDIGLLRGSLGHLKSMVKLVDITTDFKNVRPIKLPDLREWAFPFLMRNFNPPNFLEWGESTGVLSCCPAWVMHQLWEASRVVALFRAAQEKAKIVVEAEETRMRMKIECAAFARFLENWDPTLTKEWHSYVFDWFTLFQLANGEISVSGNETVLTWNGVAQIPASGETPLLLEGESDADLLKILPNSIVAGPYQLASSATPEARKRLTLALHRLTGTGIL